MTWTNKQSGKEYKIIETVNIGSKRPSHPPTVVYESVETGKRYSTTVKTWNYSMENRDEL